jgi:methyltransferase (TIGR00027 family)
VSGEPELRDISETALAVAFVRAVESERPRPLFRDPYARRLAGERGQQMGAQAGRGWRPVSTAVAVRTAVFDEFVLRAVERDGAACVLNLGAGLDTRPYRLALPPALRWVEADLPGILDYKAAQLAGERPACRLERVAVDLTDGGARRRLMDGFAGGQPTLVLSEGLLIYLSDQEVGALGRELAERFDFRWWAFDLLGPLFLGVLRRSWGRQMSAVGAAPRFGPEEGVEFFRPLGWDPVEARSWWEEARRLGRESWLMRAAWTLSPPRLRERFRTAGLCVLLARR